MFQTIKDFFAPSSSDKGADISMKGVQPSLLGFYDVIIEVTSTDIILKPLTSTVVVLLDFTFVEDKIYLKPINNVAKVTVVAYEAFTVAAICDDLETKLELDLQRLTGLPPKFYYKE